MIARKIYLALTFAVMLIVPTTIPVIVPNLFAGAAPHIAPNLNANAPALAAKPFDQPGPILAWGDDSGRQITDAPAGEFRAIAKGGANQSLAIRSDGTLVLWGGYNDPFAVPPVPTAFAGDEFVYAALGRSHALAIRPDGSVAGWGANGFGQLLERAPHPDRDRS